MTGPERRAQLLDVGRALFAERGFDGTSVEEVAARAAVSKPVVYEHFGGKDGLYAVVVDREVQRLLTSFTGALSADSPRGLLEQATLALLTYVEGCSDGFRILVRESPVGQQAAAASGRSSATSPRRSSTCWPRVPRPRVTRRRWRRCTARPSSGRSRSSASGGSTTASCGATSWPRTW